MAGHRILVPVVEVRVLTGEFMNLNSLESRESPWIFLTFLTPLILWTLYPKFSDFVIFSVAAGFSLCYPMGDHNDVPFAQPRIKFGAGSQGCGYQNR